MLTTSSPHQLHLLRDTITNAYRMDETECLNPLLLTASFNDSALKNIHTTATSLVTETREYKKRAGKIDALMHQYDLSTDEGIALMCLAEALLRIPDKTTMDKFISDKLSTVNWKNHLSEDNSLFINSATWSLVLTGKIYAPTIDPHQSLFSSLKRAISRVGIVMIRPILLQMMKAIGKQFVLGQNIQSALKAAAPLEDMGYRFSYDMLGEAARTKKDAAHYYEAYVNAIHAIGQAAKSNTPINNGGISVKLSALHPRYEFTKHEIIMQELPPLLLSLAQLAKKYNIGLTVDAEEADRLDLSLDIFERVFTDATLNNWDGLGLALQAYQKRAFYVIDWLSALSEQHKKRIMLRLVKGAYWDAEIKQSQIYSFNNYPVFTRKNSTDVSYLACAKKILAKPHCFYPQFGTHNAYSIAAIMEMTNQNTAFEFQCLHGMGRAVYDQVVDPTKFNKPCRIYAPVGTHKDLLGYLVRRLLENGANSSFINKLADDTTPIDKMVADPVKRIASLTHKPHPLIPLPKYIYGQWQNSGGIDLANTKERDVFMASMTKAAQTTWQAGSLLDGKTYCDENKKTIFSKANLDEIIGYASDANAALVDHAIQIAYTAKESYAALSVNDRAIIFEKAAELFETAMPELVAMLVKEGGKCILDSIAEVREAIDFCRYYAYRAKEDLAPITLPGPTGEANQLSLHPRGVIVCISPWNFPLAIFTGQIVAALLAGNTVIAKPAEQTPLIAYKAVQLLREAGVPKNALQLLIGEGHVVGAKLVSDTKIAGVMFTGSTETAKFIEQALANREGPIGLFIAETGGQNAMIVDSSALPEQAVIDIANSAFNSAGQRCSALRVLFVQEEIAETLLTMLKGYMNELIVSDPFSLQTDIGPLIDEEAYRKLQNHAEKMSRDGKLIAETPLATKAKGYFFAPRVFEISHLDLLPGEVFGPILHVIRFAASDLNEVLKMIKKTGYGLTLGIHSRIDATIDYIKNQMPVGNVYVNRNIIGAVVGVQPFGGEGLSGTGPKAGGPHYLPRLCVERAISTNTTAVGGNAKLVSLLEND